MRMMKTLRAAMAALLTLTICAQGLPSASAASGSYDNVKVEDCSLTIEYAPDGEPMVNNIFRIWKVGTLSERGCLPFGEIGGYHVLNGAGTWLDKASTLLGYLQRDNVAPTAVASTGEDGKVTFDIPAADQGLYLVAGDSQYRGETRYTPTPFLIMVPYSQDLVAWETDLETYSKFTTYTPPGSPDQPETIRRHVLKSWEDEDYEDERPEGIVVDLLRDGQVYDTVTLTAAGNWRYDWTDLDPQYEWAVVERESEQYSVLVKQEGITFHITNTWLEEIDPEDPPLFDDPTDPDDPDDPDDPPVFDEPTDPDDPDDPDDPPVFDEPTDPDDPDDPDDPTGPNDPDDPVGPPVFDDPTGPDDPDDSIGPPMFDDPTDPEDPEDPDDPDDEDDDDDIDDPDIPLFDGPGLPQTGQLWWPVLPMAVGGLALTALGWKRHRDWSASDET